LLSLSHNQCADLARIGVRISQALTLQYDKVLFILEPSEAAQAAIGKRVMVVDYPDSRIAIRYKGEDLTFRTFDKIRHVKQAAVVDNKRRWPLLEMIKVYQNSKPEEQRSAATRPGTCSAWANEPYQPRASRSATVRSVTGGAAGLAGRRCVF
jgi:hypothetical protein